MVSKAPAAAGNGNPLIGLYRGNHTWFGHFCNDCSRDYGRLNVPGIKLLLDLDHLW